MSKWVYLSDSKGIINAEEIKQIILALPQRWDIVFKDGTTYRIGPEDFEKLKKALASND